VADILLFLRVDFAVCIKLLVDMFIISDEDILQDNVYIFIGAINVVYFSSYGGDTLREYMLFICMSEFCLIFAVQI
jgi:hypothetical protein